MKETSKLNSLKIIKKKIEKLILRPKSVASANKKSIKKMELKRCLPLALIKKQNSQYNMINHSPLNSKNTNDKTSNENNLDIINLIVKSNLSQYNTHKISKNRRQMNSFYSQLSQKNLSRPPFDQNTEDVLYKYNILYGNNSSSIIRSYSPKMRTISSSINGFAKKIISNTKDNYAVFTEKELLLLLKAKCKDIGIEFRESLIFKFREFCNSKCKNRIIDLCDSYLGINSIKIISNVIQNNNKISRLNLTRNNIGDAGVEILMNALKNTNNLVYLNLTSNSITFKGGEIIFDSLLNQESIIDLNLSSIKGTNRNRLTSKGILSIDYFLTKNHFIETLNIAGNNIRDEGFVLVCQGLNENNFLKHISVANNGIEYKGLLEGLECIKETKLLTFDISGNKIMNKGVITFCDYLNNFTSLHFLNISECGIEFKGFSYLLNTLKYIKRLESLNISGNNLKNDEYFDHVFTLFRSINLRYLNMSKCFLGDKSGGILGKCLEINETLRTVNISDNQLTDEGFSKYFNLFKNNYTIENFDCSCNLIGDTSMKNFLPSLLNNTTLRNINFYDNQLHTNIAYLIIDLLETNKTLTHINLYYNRIQIRLIEQINRILKRNSERMKLNIVPNLLQSIKEMEYSPRKFEKLSKKIKENRKLKTHLAKKIKQEDENFISFINEENKKIDLQIQNLQNISEEIQKYEKLIKEAMKMGENSDRRRKKIEGEIKDLIFEEKQQLEDIILTQKELKTNYNLTEADFNDILKKNNEKMVMSNTKLARAKHTLETMKIEYETKLLYLDKINNPENLRPIPIMNIISNVFKKISKKRQSSVKNITRMSSVTFRNNADLLAMKEKTNKNKKEKKNSEDNDEEEKKRKGSNANNFNVMSTASVSTNSNGNDGNKINKGNVYINNGVLGKRRTIVHFNRSISQ